MMREIVLRINVTPLDG